MLLDRPSGRRDVDDDAVAPGYSDLAVTNDHMILLLYYMTKDGFNKITLARFNIAWLTDGKDSVRAKKE